MGARLIHRLLRAWGMFTGLETQGCRERHTSSAIHLADCDNDQRPTTNGQRPTTHSRRHSAGAMAHSTHR